MQQQAGEMQMKFERAMWLVVLGAVMLPGRFAMAQAVNAVPTLDLAKFMGTWYELAWYPKKPQKQCKSDALVLFTPGYKKGQFDMVSSCQMGMASSNAWNASGKLDKLGDGRLTLGIIPLFKTKYWVLAVGPEDAWALVGTPNHKSLWVLSRMTVMPPEVMAEVKGKAAAEGFDVGKLVEMPQKK